MVFNDKYADELEVYSFTSADFAAEAVLVAFFSGAAVPAVFFVGIFITP